MSIKAFGEMLNGIGGGVTTLGRALAAHLGVPYLEKREGERLLGHYLIDPAQRYTRLLPDREKIRDEAVQQGNLLPTRRFRMPNGEILDADTCPDMKAEQLTEEAWSRDNWPTSCNDVEGALGRLQYGITGVYYHRPSMNLVLVDPAGERVGIRSTALTGPFGLKTEKNLKEIRALGRLKKAPTV